MSALRYLVIVSLLFAAYKWYSSGSLGTDIHVNAAHDQLIMYSLTTCGYCKAKRHELSSAGIPYVEYFVDVDKASHKELQQKLSRAGYPPKNYGTPIFDAYGTVLPNNPSISKILAARNG